MDYIYINIKELIKLNKITPKELGDLMGKTEQTIRNYLNGRTRIDIDILNEFSKALNVPITVFFKEDGSKNTQSGKNKNSTVIQNNDGNINYTQEQKKQEKEAELNGIYWTFVQSMMESITDLIVKIIKEEPKMKKYLSEQRELKKLSAQLNTLINMSGHKFFYNEDFYKYFPNPYSNE
jgi:transcriptional regulator with XRE-family HTH domain